MSRKSVKDRIYEGLMDGAFKGGTTFEIAERYKVTAKTVYKALTTLSSQHPSLIEKRDVAFEKGIGVYLDGEFYTDRKFNYQWDMPSHDEKRWEKRRSQASKDTQPDPTTTGGMKQVPDSPWSDESNPDKLTFTKRLIYEMYNFTIGEWQKFGLDWKEKDEDYHKMVDDDRPGLYVPDYQRGFVWTDGQYDEFIESIFDRVMAPSVIIDDRDIMHQKVIDGKHRLKAIIMFFNDELIVRGTKFSELSQRDRFEFRQTTMPMMSVKHMTEEQIVDLYIKFNFTRVPHRDQDREKADRYLEKVSKK